MSNAYMMKLETAIGMMVISLDPKDNILPELCGTEEKFNRIKTLIRFHAHQIRKEMNQILNEKQTIQLGEH